MLGRVSCYVFEGVYCFSCSFVRSLIGFSRA